MIWIKGMGEKMLEELFSHAQIGPVAIKNRIIMPPMVTFLANECGGVTEKMIDYYSERARGGVGLIIVESAYIREEDRDLGRLGIENPQLQVGLSELAESIQEQGAKVFLQLNHRGGALSIRRGKGPDDLNREEIETIIEAFATAGLRARNAGFDGIEIHGASGYLITQFLSPLTNHRNDEYGGNLQGRMKFLEEIFHRVRRNVGNNYPVTLRLTGNEYTKGGLEIADIQLIAQRIEKIGASGLHISAGSRNAGYWHVPPMAIKRGCHVSLAAEVKKVVRIPVITVGRINDPFLANQVLAEGNADFVAMGRALIADPYFPRKAQEGRFEDIRKCLACNFCHKRVIQLNRRIRCAVNAEAGREQDSRLTPTAQARKVLIIGGGPAGMEAARVLAIRGHKVVLYEKEKSLGGHVNLALIPPHKEELRNIIDFLSIQVAKLGIEVHLGTEAVKETPAKEAADVIILATGASPFFPKIPGLDQGRLFSVEEALQSKAELGDKVLILGGGMVGCEVAEHLARKGKQVTIVEKLLEVASGVERNTRFFLLERLNALSVGAITDAEIVQVANEKAIVLQNGKEFEIEIDGVVAAIGAGSDQTCKDFESCGPPFYKIGDCREVRDIGMAIQEGFRVAREI